MLPPCLVILIICNFLLDLLEYLTKAKENNMVVKFQHIKVLLSGSAAAGKSSFCRLLFRHKYSAEYNSTDIMDAKQCMLVLGDQDMTIKTKQDKSRLTRTGSKAVAVKSYCRLQEKDQMVWLELSPKNQLKHLKSLLVSKIFHPSNSIDGQLTQQEQAASSSAVTIRSHTLIEKSIADSDELPTTLKMDDTVRLITVFDSGGQPEYVMLLPAINSMPTINFLVHDLTKKLEDPVLVRYNQEGQKKYPDYCLNYSNLDMMHLLMCFVTDSCDQQHEGYPNRISVPEKPYIGFIGTHYDKVRDNPEVLQSVNEQLRCVVKERNCQLAVLPPRYGVVHPVDNTTAGSYMAEDPGVRTIREKVKDVTDDLEVKELPITWMILQLELQDLRDTGNAKYISYEEYKKIAQQSASIVDEKEVKASLWYFHILGIVLYFSNEQLHNYVVIDLPWLFTNLAKIMHLSVKDIRFSDLNFEQKFDKQQLLAKKMLRKIQLPDLKQDEIQYCINVLIHLKVISTVAIEQDVYYYLPCGLPSTMQYNDGCIFLLSEPLLIQFSSGYLPRGFFCSLVVFILKERSNQWKHQLGSSSVKHYNNVVIFQLPDETFLRLHDKTYYLEVQVRHYKKDASTWYHSEILSIVKDYLEMVCNQLHFDSNKLQYGFLCHGSFDVGDHIVVLDSIEDPLPSELKCRKTPLHKTQLGDSHKIWFAKVNFNVLIVDSVYTLCE